MYFAVTGELLVTSRGQFCLLNRYTGVIREWPIRQQVTSDFIPVSS